MKTLNQSDQNAQPKRPKSDYNSPTNEVASPVDTMSAVNAYQFVYMKTTGKIIVQNI